MEIDFTEKNKINYLKHIISFLIHSLILANFQFLRKLIFIAVNKRWFFVVGHWICRFFLRRNHGKSPGVISIHIANHHIVHITYFRFVVWVTSGSGFGGSGHLGFNCHTKNLSIRNLVSRSGGSITTSAFWSVWRNWSGIFWS